MPRSSWDGQLPMAFRIWLTASAMAAWRGVSAFHDYWQGCDSLYGQFKRRSVLVGYLNLAVRWFRIQYPVFLACQPSWIALHSRIKSSSSTVPANTGTRRKLLCLVNSTISENAVMAQARPDFMSQAPLPYRRPSFTITSGQGLFLHPSPASPYPYGICTQGQAPELFSSRYADHKIKTARHHFLDQFNLVLKRSLFPLFLFVNHSYIHCSIWPPQLLIELSICTSCPAAQVLRSPSAVTLSPPVNHITDTRRLILHLSCV